MGRTLWLEFFKLSEKFQGIDLSKMGALVSEYSDVGQNPRQGSLEPILCLSSFLLPLMFFILLLYLETGFLCIPTSQGGKQDHRRLLRLDGPLSFSPSKSPWKGLCLARLSQSVVEEGRFGGPCTPGSLLWFWERGL